MLLTIMLSGLVHIYYHVTIPRHTKYVSGYIVLSFCPFICSSSVCPFVNFTSKFCLKHLVIADMSVTIYKILFIFGL